MLSDSTKCRKGYKGKNHKRDTLYVSRDSKDDWREDQDESRRMIFWNMYFIW